MAMHVVMTSCAKMPSSVKAPYRNIAVVQLNQEYTAQNKRPKMLSERAHGVLRVIRMGYYHVGKTERSEYRKQLKRAEELAARLNSVGEVAEGDLLISTGSA